VSVVIVILTLSYSFSQAQWANSGNNIYNTNSDNVGIGTGTAFTPTDKLHINNESNIAGVMAESSYTGTTRKAIGYYRIKNAATGDMFNIVLRKNGSTHEMIQSCYDASTSTWREFAYFNYATGKYEIRSGIVDAEFLNSGKILFNNTGNVGIGYSNPTQKLCVNGKILCKEVEVTLDGWSDYVFYEGYQLKPLSEVESFINQHKHLPDVPGETDLLVNGTDLGKITAILLQKIEELTLYVIELEKKNETLNAKIVQMDEER